MKMIRLVTAGSRGWVKEPERNFRRIVRKIGCGGEIALPGGLRVKLYFDAYDETVEPELEISAPDREPLICSLKHAKTLNLLDRFGYMVAVVADVKVKERLQALFIEFGCYEAEVIQYRRG